MKKDVLLNDEAKNKLIEMAGNVDRFNRAVKYAKNSAANNNCDVYTERDVHGALIDVLLEDGIDPSERTYTL